jgi:inosine/xanthosine triphosphate pyrophosphatase family protein
MTKKQIYLKTNSDEKLKEISKQFDKYNIIVTNDNNDILNCLYEIEEHSVLEIINSEEQTARVSSILLINKSNKQGPKLYTYSIDGFLKKESTNKDAWGFDDTFIPRGHFTTYYELKKKGLKISPRDVNIGNFIKDYIWHDNVQWSHSLITFNKPIDLFQDTEKVLLDFFSNALFDWSKHVVKQAIKKGIFLRSANNRTIGNYWWPVGNAGIPVTPKPKDIMHERTYLMHDIFHFHIPDLLYTGRTFNTEYENKLYDWICVAHRLTTECFTLVLGDMFYVHECTINGVVYETVDKRRLYPIFRAIFKETDPAKIFKNDTIEKVVRASSYYGLLSSSEGFLNLFIEYNKNATEEEIIEFKSLLDSFREKYDAYIIQDLRWTANNISFMRKHKEFYNLNLCGIGFNTEDLGIYGALSIFSKLQGVVDKLSNKEIVDILVDNIFKQLMESLSSDYFNMEPIVTKFCRWAIGQLYFLKKYKFPFTTGYYDEFKGIIKKVWFSGNIAQINEHILLFKNKWNDLMNMCVSCSIITKEEALKYNDVYPIFDPQYISAYTYEEKNHEQIMKSFFDEIRNEELEMRN